MKTKNVILTDEIKKLIQLNVSSEDFRGVNGEFCKNDAGQWGYWVDWNNLQERYINVCLENMAIMEARNATRQSIKTPLVGDYLEMPDGSVSRITYLHEDGAQDGGGSGSFFLYKSGNGSYSGSLNSSKPYEKMEDTRMMRPALFWFFSRDWSGANRSFHFYINVRVWKIKSYLKTVYVRFPEWKYNYHTNVNGNLSDEEIKKYFIGTVFNLGNSDKDDLQTCTDCAIYY